MRSKVAAPTLSAASGGGGGGDIAFVAAQLAIQRGGIDAEYLGGARLVAALALQYPGDVRALDHVEGRVRVRPIGHQWLGSTLGELVGQRREIDRRRLAEHHGALEGVFELADVAGPVEIGRASCRERVWISGGAVCLRKKMIKTE